MKQVRLILAFLAFTLNLFAQNAIPNGNFEAWDVGNNEYPQGYPYTSNAEAFMLYHLPFTLSKTTDAFHGSYAVMLTTTASATDTSAGYFANGTSSNGNPFTWTGGIPYNQIPTGIKGYYKYNVATADSAIIILPFSKAGTNIGTYIYKIGGIHNTYTPFNFTFSPPLTQTPDSVFWGIASFDISQGSIGIPGTTLFIDSLAFTGVASQPPTMNGDFENWQTETLLRPTNWYTQEQGTTRTSDAAIGNYAMQLTTLSAPINGTLSAIAARVTSAYWVDACNCYLGGIPFTNQTDTLAFYYKYAPAANDTAFLNINFQKDGANISGLGFALSASDIYQYIEIPFNTGQTPDTVQIHIASSGFENTSLNYVGSILKIDGLHFKSTPLNTNILTPANAQNTLSISPNPSGGKFQLLPTALTMPNNYNIQIFTLNGEKIYQAPYNPNNPQIDISNQPNAIYIITLTNGKTTLSTKILKQ